MVKQRMVEVEGWKGKDAPEIYQERNEWVIIEHRKRKFDGEVKESTHRIPTQNVGVLWQLIKDRPETHYRELVPMVIEAWHLEVELEAFNGGKNRARHYFPLLYYPLKVLENLGYIEYSGRGKVTNLRFAKRGDD